MNATFLLLIALLGQEESVTLGLKGVDSSFDHAVVRKDLAKALPKMAVRWWADKTSISIQVCPGAGKKLKLSTIERALAETRKTLKDSRNLEVSYRIDEERVALDGATWVSGTGTQDRDYVERLFTLLPEVKTSELTAESEGWKVLLTWSRPGKLSVLRKMVEDASLKLSDVELPGKALPPAAHECPNGCSSGTAEARCPECSLAMQEKKVPKSSSG